MVTNYRLSYVSAGYSAQFCMHLFLASNAGGREIPMQMPGVVCREVKFGALTAVTSQCLQWVDILTAVLLMECKQHLQHLQNVYAILSTHWLMCSIKKKRERERVSWSPCLAGWPHARWHVLFSAPCLSLLCWGSAHYWLPPMAQAPLFSHHTCWWSPVLLSPT